MFQGAKIEKVRFRNLCSHKEVCKRIKVKKTDPFSLKLHIPSGID